MNKSGKVWGTTSKIFAHNNVEIHRIEIKKEGHCSVHAHAHKYNLFFVESGLLLITVQQKDYDLVDHTILEPGQSHEVPPGLFHSFQALSDTVAYEVYRVSLDERDIIRKTVGGILQPGEDTPQAVEADHAPD